MWGSNPLLLGENPRSSCVGVADPGVWSFALSHLCPSHPWHCGSFFTTWVVEKLFILMIVTLEIVTVLVCSWEEVSSRSFCAAILSPEDPQAMWTFLFLLASLNRFYGFSSSYHLTSALFCLLVSWLLSVNPLLLSSSSRAFRSHVWIYLEPRPPSLTPLFLAPRTYHYNISSNSIMRRKVL